MAKITCVVNAHRESNLITPTLKSVSRARQYASNCGLHTHLLVILDNSDDDTISVVEQSIDDDATIIATDKCDLALSRNFAVSESSSEYICFLDGDDLWCKSWLVDSYIAAERLSNEVILHPEYNIYFGSEHAHTFKHVDSESSQFESENLLQFNYWTALSFAKRSIYLKYPYKKNTLLDGFGFEDWTWNYETLSGGIMHKTVKNTAHYIRRGKDEPSLLDLTNLNNSVPRILDIYRNQSCNLVNSKAA
ncbi:MAG: glycosyltransferase family 2 protein [Granulosicoccus sp.]